MKHCNIWEAGRKMEQAGTERNEEYGWNLWNIATSEKQEGKQSRLELKEMKNTAGTHGNIETSEKQGGKRNRPELKEMKNIASSE